MQGRGCCYFAIYFIPVVTKRSDPIHLTNHRVSNAQNYSLRCEHFVVKSVEFVLIQAYCYPCTLYLKSSIKPPGSLFQMQLRERVTTA